MRYTTNPREDRLTEPHSNFVTYEKGERVTTEVIPATWSRVFYFAVINAVLISLCRVVWYESFGRPELFSYHPALESELVNE